MIAACAWCGTAPTVPPTATTTVVACSPPATAIVTVKSAPHSGANETAPGDDSPQTHQEFDSEPLPDSDSSIVRSFGPSFNAVPGRAHPGSAQPGNPRTERSLV